MRLQGWSVWVSANLIHTWRIRWMAIVDKFRMIFVSVWMLEKSGSVGEITRMLRKNFHWHHSYVYVRTFQDPQNISGMDVAINLKFGVQVEHKTW